MADKNGKGLRVDRWLWHTRFYRTRTMASAAVQSGGVRINGKRARPGTPVSAGDVVELKKNRLAYKLEVVSLPPRRLSASSAQECYSEDSAAREQRMELVGQLGEDRRRMPRTRGRPDKRTRRLIRDRNRRPSDGAH
ncbi:MAG: RNA-binding S4 domain-containing protein [Woeseia sp.]